MEAIGLQLLGELLCCNWEDAQRVCVTLPDHYV